MTDKGEEPTSQHTTSVLESFGLGAIALEIQGLVKEKSLDAVQKYLLVGVEQALMDPVARSSDSSGGRARPRDLLSEAERILHRASRGLSLWDRLQRDS